MLKIRITPTQSLAAADRQALDAMLDEAFGADPIGGQYQWCGNDWNLMLEAGAELAAHVGIVERTVLAGGQPVRVGGVGAVATRLAWRRQGCARQLLEAAAVFMRAELQAAAGLLVCSPTMAGYYGRLGWQVVPGPLWIDQPQGKVQMPATIMVLPLHLPAWPAGPIDLCGLPW